MKNIKKILIAVLSFSLLFAISCSNEDKTGGDTGGNSGNGGMETGGNSGGSSGEGNSGSGEVEILTPEEWTYNIIYSSDYYIPIIVKINEDNTIQISGKSSSINYKNFADMNVNYNCKTSDWTKQSGTDYKISKSIVSEKLNDNTETIMNNSEAKWRYILTNGYKYIELDLNFEDNNGRPFRSVALKIATR